MTRGAPLLDRFEPEPMSGCWLWIGGIRRDGYGQIWANRRQRLAHVVMYEMARRLVPPGLELDHKCRTRSCVNPAHLEAVTHRENIRRGSTANKTACVHGHPFDLANTGFRRSGGRFCRTCSRAAIRAAGRKRHHALRGAALRVTNALKTHCIHGHCFDDDNTYRTRSGKRQCRACQRATDHARRR